MNAGSKTDYQLSIFFLVLWSGFLLSFVYHIIASSDSLLSHIVGAVACLMMLAANGTQVWVFHHPLDDEEEHRKLIYNMLQVKLAAFVVFVVSFVMI